MVARKSMRRVVAKVLTRVKRVTVSEGELRDETNLLDEIGLDSLELTELMLGLEDELGTELNLKGLERHHLEQLARFEVFLSE